MTISLVSTAQVSLIKKALRDIFPTIKSSHLTEAISYAQGFNTSAADQASLKELNKIGSQSDYIRTLDSERFSERLIQFGYDIKEAFSFDQVSFIGENNAVPARFRELIRDIALLEDQNKPHQPTIAKLRYECIKLFSEHFRIGQLEVRGEPTNRVCKWTVGITHQQTHKVGWGRKVDFSNDDISFPGQDHVESFVHQLPLSNGKYVEYINAVVSMPYLDSDRLRRIEDSKKFAAEIGWTTEIHKDWTWYQSKATTLVLYRRTTSKEIIENLWEKSFKKWLIENKSSIKKGMTYGSRLIVDNAIACQHLPLDLVDYEDCTKRYLEEFVFENLHGQYDQTTKVYKKLFEKWQKSKIEMKI